VSLRDGYTVPLSQCKNFGFTDPSLGKTTSADPSALTVVGKAPNGIMFCLECDKRIRTPDRILDAQRDMAERYKITRWGIESNQFQALFAAEAAKKSAAEGVYLPIIAVNQISNKALRIQGLQPDVENGYVLFPEVGQESLRAEMEYWPSGEDDALDSLEGAVRLAKGAGIVSQPESIQGEVHDFWPRKMKVGAVEDDPWSSYDAEAERVLRAERALLGLDEPEEEPWVPVTYY